MSRRASKFDYKGYILLLLSIVILIAAVFVGYEIWITKQRSDDLQVNKADFSDVRAICELATLRSYYHNVAELEKFPDGLYQYGWGKYGYKKLWLEYSGTVELGIDANKVLINEPDVQGFVKVFVPPVQILNVYFDKESMQIPVCDTGVLTSITAADEADAFAEAQKTMREIVAGDDRLFSQAENHAKQLIKEFILNIGKQIGEEYTVEWITDPSS